MQFIQSYIVMTPALLVMVGGSARADDAAQELLKSRGLNKVGQSFILTGEKDLADGMQKLDELQNRLNRAVKQERDCKKTIAEMKKQIAEQVRERLKFSKLLTQTKKTDEQNQLIAKTNELTDRINLLQQEIIHNNDAEAARDKAAAAQSELLAQVRLLREKVTATEAAYAVLAADPKVTAALQTMNEGVEKKFSLGPTKKFLAKLKDLAVLEASVQTEAVSLRQEGNTYWISVVINGGVGKSMVLDTGAGLVTIPHEWAANLGLDADDDAPILKLTVADGRTVEARLAILKSVQVGDMKVEGVECAVMPAELVGAPPLLGGSFLKHFTFTLEPGKSSVTLARVETKPGK